MVLLKYTENSIDEVSKKHDHLHPEVMCHIEEEGEKISNS